MLLWMGLEGIFVYTEQKEKLRRLEHPSSCQGTESRF